MKRINVLFRDENLYNQVIAMANDQKRSLSAMSEIMIDAGIKSLHTCEFKYVGNAGFFKCSCGKEKRVGP